MLSYSFTAADTWVPSEMLIMFFKNQMSLKELKTKLNQFEIERSVLKAKESEIQEKMANDGFDEVLRYLNTEE